MTRLAAFAALALLATACKDQEVDTGDTDTDTDSDTDVAGYMVAVSVDGTSADVDLSDLATVDFNGDTVIGLQTVVEASGLGATWADRLFDFEASDGFRPTSRGYDPVNWTALGSGYIYPETGNLAWDDALGLPGAFSVDGVVLIEAQAIQ